MELMLRCKNKIISRLGFFLFSAFLLTLFGYGWYWNMLAEKFIDTIVGWAEARGAEGYEINYESIETGGFPFFLHVKITYPKLSTFNKKQSWNWRGPTLRLSTRPWRIEKIEVSASGRHLAKLTTQHGTRDLDIEAGNLRIFLEWAAMSALPVVVQGELKDASYRYAPVLGLGRATKIIGFRADLKGAPLRSINAIALEQWRKQGGALQIKNLSIHHGPLKVEGEGSLAINENLQPLAAFNFKVRGYIEAVDRLQSSKLIKPIDARLMKTVLSMMAGGKGYDVKDKGENGINIPLSIQEGYFYVGPLSLGRVPTIHWSALN